MKKYRVLLADDHAVVRSGIRNAIECLPSIIVIGEAEDGPSLMTSLEKLRPDILLIDVTMPNFEPISTISLIRSEYPMMKILVISAYDDDIYVQGLLGAGVDGYHLKDQPLHDLTLAIQRIIQGKRWISSPLVEKLVNFTFSEEKIPSLTSRQREILILLKKGWNNQKIAYELGLSIKTIENHLTRIYRSLNVQSRLEAVNFVNNNPRILSTNGKIKNSQPDPLYGSAVSANILIVDDNPRFRYHLSRIVGKLFSNINIHEAENIDAVFDAVQTTNFELMFVDVILGDQNGISLLKTLKKYIENTRIVLISAYPDKEFHRQGLEAGAAAFIDKKMLDSDTIRQIIGDILPNKMIE
jgi:DNA-binding NarL/FixJ family response regulator